METASSSALPAAATTGHSVQRSSGTSVASGRQTRNAVRRRLYRSRVDSIVELTSQVTQWEVDALNDDLTGFLDISTTLLRCVENLIQTGLYMVVTSTGGEDDSADGRDLRGSDAVPLDYIHAQSQRLLRTITHHCVSREMGTTSCCLNGGPRAGSLADFEFADLSGSIQGGLEWTERGRSTQPHSGTPIMSDKPRLGFSRVAVAAEASAAIPHAHGGASVSSTDSGAPPGRNPKPPITAASGNLPYHQGMRSSQSDPSSPRSIRALMSPPDTHSGAPPAAAWNHHQPWQQQQPRVFPSHSFTPGGDVRNCKRLSVIPDAELDRSGRLGEGQDHEPTALDVSRLTTDHSIRGSPGLSDRVPPSILKPPFTSPTIPVVPTYTSPSSPRSASLSPQGPLSHVSIAATQKRADLGHARRKTPGQRLSETLHSLSKNRRVAVPKMTPQPAARPEAAPTGPGDFQVESDSVSSERNSPASVAGPEPVSRWGVPLAPKLQRQMDETQDQAHMPHEESDDRDSSVSFLCQGNTSGHQSDFFMMTRASKSFPHVREERAHSSYPVKHQERNSEGFVQLDAVHSSPTGIGHQGGPLSSSPEDVENLKTVSVEGGLGKEALDGSTPSDGSVCSAPPVPKVVELVGHFNAITADRSRRTKGESRDHGHVEGAESAHHLASGLAIGAGDTGSQDTTKGLQPGLSADPYTRTDSLRAIKAGTATGVPIRLEDGVKPRNLSPFIQDEDSIQLQSHRKGWSKASEQAFQQPTEHRALSTGSPRVSVSVAEADHDDRSTIPSEDDSTSYQESQVRIVEDEDELFAEVEDDSGKDAHSGGWRTATPSPVDCSGPGYLWKSSSSGHAERWATASDSETGQEWVPVRGDPRPKQVLSQRELRKSLAAAVDPRNVNAKLNAKGSVAGPTVAFRLDAASNVPSLEARAQKRNSLFNSQGLHSSYKGKSWQSLSFTNLEAMQQPVPPPPNGNVPSGTDNPASCLRDHGKGRDLASHKAFTRPGSDPLQSKRLPNPPTKAKSDPHLRGAEFRTQRDMLAGNLYREFNRVVFVDRLPLDMEIRWSGAVLSRFFKASKNPKDRCHIVLSSVHVDDEDKLRSALIHHMCHGAAILIHKAMEGQVAHQTTFLKWAKRAMHKYPDIAITPCRICSSIEKTLARQCSSKTCGVVYPMFGKNLDMSGMACGQCGSDLVISDSTPEYFNGLERLPEDAGDDEALSKKSATRLERISTLAKRYRKRVLHRKHQG